MLSQGRDELRYYQFDSFDHGLCQAVFTRRGGVSPEPWASLNLGGTVGDDSQRVRENRRRALAALGRDPGTVYDVWQVHGVEVAITRAPRQPETPHLQADAILTDQPGLTLMMRFADCVPVLLHDPARKVAGIAHAGWLGTVRGVVLATVEAMRSQFDSNPADLLAGIGPSIGPDHYEVGAEVVLQVRQAFGADASSLLVGRGGRMFFDLWAANRLQLERAGVTHIETAGLCTVCHNDDWFSHRAEHGRTGRFGAVIALT
ncbi:MAG: peptidoglycan editing factor PgeF [Chloroflexi bacterium]|nr:peptidoglycan editing factor PgeF [Chloroflexota bacterium]